MEVIIRLTVEEIPTVQDVLDYINELGVDLDFEIKVDKKERKWNVPNVMEQE